MFCHFSTIRFPLEMLSILAFLRPQFAPLNRYWNGEKLLLKGVLGNRSSEIVEQHFVDNCNTKKKPWKIFLKNYVFGKVAYSQPATLLKK